MNMDHDYAHRKLEALLNNLPAYTGGEFWRQMSRIAAGATGADHAEEITREREALEFQKKNREGLVQRAIQMEERYSTLAAHVERIRDAWMIDDTGIHDKRVEHVRLPYLRYEAVNQAIMSAPTSSFTRQKLLWQAEALRAFARRQRESLEALPARDRYALHPGRSADNWHHIVADLADAAADRIDRDAEEAAE